MPSPAHAPTIPAAYVQLIARLCTEQGMDTAVLLQPLDRAALNDPGGRLPLLQVAQLLQDVVQDYPAISYDIGLNASLTTHGFVGMGLMALPDVRTAIEFGRRFVGLRTPFVGFRCRTEGQMAALVVESTMPLGPLRGFVFEHFLVGIWSVAQKLANTIKVELNNAELLFSLPCPAYFETYRDRLPACHFDQPVNALRFPAAFLDWPLSTAAQLVQQQCERELAEVGGPDRLLVPRVRSILTQEVTPPILIATARRLHLSPRSLKRKLAAEGASYKQLVEQHCQQLARQWLRGGTLSVAEIATRLGYSDPANFSRAFRQWTGRSPSAFRQALPRP